MSFLLVGLIVVLALAFSASWHRRADLRHQREVVEERAQMALRGKDAAPLQVPVIDLSTCLGCGACVRACPEDGVLQLVHGQAAVVNAAACVGHARCVAECPVGAVSLTQGDLSARADVPALDGELQAVGTEGLFLIGEITARSLIRTATVQGTQVAATIAARRRTLPRASRARDLVDVAIVGAGPGGLACALACKQHGLVFDLIDQEPVIGGTVAKYPRRKLVVTDPVVLPLHGRLEEREYEKEELIELWQRLARVHELPFRGGVTFHFVERRPDGTFAVHTDAGIVRARYVVLAVGRRGTPRRLGVPGENLPHVAYGLLDAAAYTGQHVVVVGGGDSAVETALVLAEQPDNQVTIVYRKDAFFRIRRKNRERLEAQLADGRIEVMYGTELTSIARGHVDVSQHGKRRVALQVRADHVFVMAGGMAPFAQLAQSGVSFDPAKRLPAQAPAAAPGGGLLPALGVGLVLATAALGFVLWHQDYYTLPAAGRAADPKHAMLRSDRSLGLWFGLLATAAIVANLAYLLRRHQWWGMRFGQLSTWMTSHVGTGVVAVLLTMLHAGMAPRETPGGHAFWALVLLLGTGAIGRWFYAWLPRSANGRELELGQLRAELATEHGFGETAQFAQQAKAEVLGLLDRRQWHSSWLGRVLALAGLQWDLRFTLRRLRRSGRAANVEPAVLAQVIERTRAAHRAAVAVAHLEDLRAVLGTWRWLHRWLALLLVILVLVHVVTAMWHGVFAGGGGL